MPVEIFGIKLVGITAEDGEKFLLSVSMIAALYIIHKGAILLTNRLLPHENLRARFWGHQIINVVITVVLTMLLLSIWFNNPTNLAIGLGLVTAGLVFALQRVITALAGYLVILRGKNFNVGDQIVMGVSGVR